MRYVAMDIETYDPNLKTKGDGSIRKDGYILCCGVYGDGFNEVIDFGYSAQVQKLKDILADESIAKIFHNGIYDLSWLVCGYDFKVNGQLHDTMTRAALIDEYQPLGLDACCKRLGLKGKNKDETIEAWYEKWQDKIKPIAKLLKSNKCIVNKNQVFNPKTEELYDFTDIEAEVILDGSWSKDVWHNLKVVWADQEGRRLMKEYNIQDCIATYNLFKAQEKYMTQVQRVYKLECDIIPVLLKMKKTGIKIDTNHLNSLTAEVQEACRKSEQSLIDIYGITGEMINSSKQLGARLNEMGIYSPVVTKTGAQSWSADAISRIHHPVIEKIEEYKNYNSILVKYLQGSLSEAIINGRIHCTFYPMLREDGGTVTGRFSCKNPNLQQIPARNKGHGQDFSQDMRSLFLPNDGQMLAAMDYSQIEYLLLAHFAVGAQAEWFREQANAGVDFHKVAMQATGITYRPVVKTFNYGVIYGMGWKTAMIKNYNLFEKLAKEHNEDIETFTKNIYSNYHKKLPVIKETMAWCQEMAKAQGYIDTMGGRRLHKPRAAYDPVTGKINDFIYKMLNKLIQGTAADILKTALVTAYKEGIYDVLDLHLLVHDEQVVSVPFNKEGTEAVVRLQQIMGDVYGEQLRVPMKAECELGPNWGYWAGDIFEAMKGGDFNPEYFNKNYKETH